MTSVIDRILGPKKTSAESIRAEETKAEHVLESAQRALADAKASYKTALLDEKPEAAARARQHISEREIEVERAEALVHELRQRFLAVCENEAEAARIEQYERAQRAIADAQKQVAKEYPEAARTILRLVEVAASALCEVERANANSPAGRAPIGVPAILGGQISGADEVVIERRVVEKWTFETTGRIVNDEHQVMSTGQGRGVLEGANRNQPVVLRMFEEVRFHPAESHQWNMPFFSRMALPSLDGSQPPYWGAAGDDPEAVVSYARESLLKLKSKPITRSRPIHTRLEPL